MDLESAREDTVVAVAAAGTAIAVTAVTELVLELNAPLVVRAIPLFVYLFYRLSRKGGPYGIAVTAVTELVLELNAPLVVRAIPLFVYLFYRLSRKGGPYGSLDTPVTWAAVAVASGVATVVLAVA